ncbi:MAG: T9SS type A sorting domain-containing protein [Lewinellaceae bacterium]|nr:T9SS type A sorting domain-containing protein [Lewinellaceae bacterium]
MNILVIAGTYRVTLNTATGEYAFTEPSSTTNLLDGNSISIAPNPAKDVLNITVTAQELKGDVQVTLFNQKGQKVLTSNLNIQDRATLQVGNVQPGVYTLHMTNGKSIVGKQVVIVK